MTADWSLDIWQERIPLLSQEGTIPQLQRLDVTIGYRKKSSRQINGMLHAEVFLLCWPNKELFQLGAPSH